MKYPAVIFGISSLLVTIFLFYIDEGNYHLKGILHLSNLIPLVIYFIGIFTAKLSLFRFIQPRTALWPGLLMSMLLGSIIGTLLAAGFFVGLSALRTIG